MINEDDLVGWRESYSHRQRDEHNEKKDAKEKKRDGRPIGPLPKLHSIYSGCVVSIQPYGAFVEIEGFQRQGLVHISQLATYKVEKVEDIVNTGDRIWAKVIEIDQDTGKFSMSMKFCSQNDGHDLDSNNVNLSLEQRKRKKLPSEAQKIEIGAVLNTVCTRCGGAGHMAMDCYTGSDRKYDLVDENEDTRVAETSPSHKKRKRESKKKDKKSKHKAKKKSNKKKKSHSSSSDSDVPIISSVEQAIAIIEAFK